MDNKKIPTHLGTAILVIIAITAGVFVWVYEKNQSLDAGALQTPVVQKKAVKSNPNQAQMKEVSFCGKIYKSDQVTINDMDIIDTLSSLAKKETWLCKNMGLGTFQENGIGIAQKKEGDNSYLAVIFHKGNPQEENNPFDQSPYIFKFNFKNNEALYQNQLDGRFKYLGAIQ